MYSSIPCYSARMFLRFLHRFRIVLAACVGIAIALATAAGIFLSLRADPKTLNLAQRIDPTRAMVFITTPDRERFFEVIDHFAGLMNESMPTEQDVAPADTYEFALLSSGSGSTDWIIYGRKASDDTHVTLVSNDDPSLFLAPTERRHSLAGTAFFAAATKSATSLLWFKTLYLPLPTSESADIARALLAPHEEVAILFGARGQGRLMVINDTLNLRGTAPDLTISNDPASLLGMSLSEPAAILENFTRALQSKNPALTEGITGILKAQAQTYLGSSDLALIAHDLLSGPASLTLRRNNMGEILFAFSSTAGSTIIRDSWLVTMASAMKEGNVRRMEFFKKEYTRTDVTAADTTGWRGGGTYKNWSLRHLGGTGSDVSLTLAVSGRRYVAGNDTSLVEAMIDSNAAMSTSLASGTADIGVLSQETETRLPFLQPVRSTVEALLGPSPEHLTWRMTQVGDYLTIDWSLSRAAAMQN